MQTEKAIALVTCSVCGQAFSANERLVFENPQSVRHHTCPKDKLVDPDQIPVELSQQRRQSGGTCEELAEDQEHAPQWPPSRTGNPKWEEVVIWLFVVAVIILSVLAGYLLRAKLSFHSPS